MIASFLFVLHGVPCDDFTHKRYFGREARKITDVNEFVHIYQLRICYRVIVVFIMHCKMIISDRKNAANARCVLSFGNAKINLKELKQSDITYLVN